MTRVQKEMLGKLVVVDWVDSCGSTSWHGSNVAEVCLPARCQTAGYLAHADGERVLVCRSRAMTREMMPWEGPINIPRAAVTGIAVVPARYWERRKR